MRKRSVVIGGLLAAGLLAVPVAAAADSVRITADEPGSVRITGDDTGSVRITSEPTPDDKIW
ncbi:hypothetical protein GCM10009789_24010 [Kribbella sancticallisti]|uniref:Uncharacterized protein n=1 Tax=Kribbella sancticallisti TaxID=460087 RepID=A0ABP4NZB8_9ACTN